MGPGNTVETVQEEVEVEEEEVISEQPGPSKQEKVLTFLESFLTKKIDDIEEIKEEVQDEEPDHQSLMEKSLGLLSEPSENIPGAEDNFATLSDLQNHYKDFLVKIQQQLSTLGGGGETRLEFLDDVDRDTAKVDGKYLKYEASSGKFIGATGFWRRWWILEPLVRYFIMELIMLVSFMELKLYQ